MDKRAHGMLRKLRINGISPPWVKEMMTNFGMDPTLGLASADLAKADVGAVDRSHQGQDPRPLPARRIARRRADSGVRTVQAVAW